MSKEFPNTPENFHDRPITRPVLESTGLPEGDDSGYRNVPVCESNELLVDMASACKDVLIRSSYDGYDEVDGSYNPELVLPDGIDGKVYARRSAAIALDAANGYLADRYGSNMTIGVLDVLRGGKRQAAGFTKTLIQVLDGNTRPDIKTLYKAAMTADGTFSWVSPDFESSQYREFLADFTAASGSFKSFQEIATETGTDINTVITNFACICANVKAAAEHFPKAPEIPLNIDIPLNAQNNVHAGGGAIDGFLMVDGKPASSPVPFDWVGEEAGIEYMESDENLDRYRQRVKELPVLQNYLTRLGIDPNNVTTQQWHLWRACNRILRHTMAAVGATYYSAADPKQGGENWHNEPGNIVLNPTTGQVIHTGGFADIFPDSGNPGHALQRMPKGNAVAVWGGKGAQEQLGL